MTAKVIANDVIPSDHQRCALLEAAWRASKHAHIHNQTMVGAAVLSASGRIYAGCNVEHRFRSHDVHAEVNALTNMTSVGDGPAVAIVITSHRERFTPCGACMDWIFELGSGACIVTVQSNPTGPAATWRADELMPFYPQ
jgi:cytidine deaminase